MTLSLHYAVRSDRGLVRGDNEDSVYAGPRLLALADGMGGHVGGGTASRVVITTFAPLDDDTAAQDMLGALRATVDAANLRLREAVQSDPGLEGMGTTLTAMLFNGEKLGVVHVGDSRAYVLQGRKFSQVTRDQTFVQALVDEGRITMEEARSHPQRSVILRAMTGSDVDPDLSIRTARRGDRYLICSDGLSDYVSGDTIADALKIEDAHEAADRLIELALRAGGRDNITVVVADIVDAEEGDVVPVIDGAASDSLEDREVHPTSAAARAAIAMPPGQSNPGQSDPDSDDYADDYSDDPDADTAEFPDATAPPRRIKRRIAVALGAVVVVVGALGGLYAWSQTQYFVGASANKVTIFKGVNMSLAGAHLYHPVHTSEVAVGDLVSTARDKVRAGLSADSRSGAEKIISNLNSSELLPVCPTATPTPSPTPSPSRSAAKPPRRSAKPPAHRTTAHRTTAHRSPAPTHPTATHRTQPAATHPAAIVAAPTPVPGKDCR
ncbi:MAG TPA: protein phosphatase 2C domain-containing protein [Mycobacteriales bacterium]|nr:protein phosphatase 2C domain-containing protein [Mycobacteriales bacterium]